MTASPIVDAFPRRPLSLTKSPEHTRRRLLWLLGVVALAILPLYGIVSDLRMRSLRNDLLERGVEGEVLSADGSCLSRRQITGDEPRGCNFEITYRLRKEEGGDVRTAEVWLSGSAPGVFAPPALYDPQDPSRVMLKPEVEREPELDTRVGSSLLMLIPALALLAWFATGRGALAKAARDPRPVVVPIERTVWNGQARRTEVWFERPGGGNPLRNDFRENDGPLLARPPDAADGRQYALGLLTPKGVPVLLDKELKMIDLSEEERAAVLRAAWA